MALRWYQEQAVAACWDYLREKTGSPVLVLPTGSGKTHVLSEICRKVVTLGGRVVILAHVKELLEQAADKLAGYIEHDKIGVYSAGLNKRETQKPVTVAGIQSIYTRAAELGSVQLVIVDEAHMIPPEGSGRYRTFLSDLQQTNPKARLIGLTATPYRLGAGWIVKDRAGDDGKDRLFDTIAYEAQLYTLIKGGFLSQVISKGAKQAPDFSDVHTTRGDFDESEIERVLSGKNVLEAICREIVEKTRDRKKVLIFCNRRESARRCVGIIGNLLHAETNIAAEVDGETPSGQRAEIIAAFREDPNYLNLFDEPPTPIKYLCNVGVFTTGFDAPNVDCVALLRPTKSLTLYQQMVGRGLRKCDEKSNCLILDFGGNIDRHGPIDTAAPQEYGKESKPRNWKECKACGTFNALNARTCKECGAEFERRDVDPNKNLVSKASGGAILSSEVGDPEKPIIEEFNVVRLEVEEHYKRNAEPGTPPTLQCKYTVIGPYWAKFEWLCPEHGVKMRGKFKRWWEEKSNAPAPETVREAVALINAGFLATPYKIETTTKPRNKFPDIKWLEFSDVPRYDPEKAKRALNEEDFLNDFGAFEEDLEPLVVTPAPTKTCDGCVNYSPDDIGGAFWCKEWGETIPEELKDHLNCFRASSNDPLPF